MKSGILKYWKPLGAVVLWGISFVATKIVLNDLAPLQLIFLRLLLGSAFLFMLAVISKKSFSIDLKNHGLIFILALIGVLHLWIQVTGLQYTTATNTGWIIGITPVIMALLGLIFFKEYLNLIKTSGILIAFFGLLLLISRGDLSQIGLISNKGDFLVLGSAFTWGFYSMVNKKISAQYSPLLTILFLFIIMAIIISPFVFTSDFFSRVQNISTESLIAILFLGILCSGLAYVLWAQSLAELDSTRTGAFLYFEPMVTVAAAWIILNEQITLLILISGLIITLGVVLVNLNLKRILFRKSK